MKLEIPAAFEDVAITFTDEEWKMLTEEEKELHRLVMVQNFETMISVGYSIPPEHLLSLIEKGDGATSYSLLGDKLILAKNHFEVLQSASRDETQWLLLPKCQKKLKGETSTQQAARKNFPDQLTLCENKDTDYHRDISTCKECGQCFGQKRELLSHVWADRIEKQFDCVTCGISFKHKLVQTLHQQTHLEKQCNNAECNVNIADKSDFTRPQSVQLEAGPFRCYDCGIIFRDKGELSAHKCEHQQVKLSCTECGKSFKWQRKLELHQRVHTVPKLFTCSDCGMSFIEKDKLHEHQKSHPKKPPPFKCTDCGKGFRWNRALLLHQKVHVKEKEIQQLLSGKVIDLNMSDFEHQQEKLSCSECGKRFKWQRELELHQRMHIVGNFFKCLDCGMSFTEKSKLYEHQEVHPEKLPFQCTDCGRVFRLNRALLLHQKVHIKEKKIQQCLSGNVIVQNMSDFEHQQVKLSCTECGKSFKWRRKLELHQRVHAFHQRAHTAETPFMCSDCGISFTEKDKLFEHHKVHPKKLPFQCTDCGKVFKWNRALLVHQKVHIKEKEIRQLLSGNVIDLNMSDFEHA
ncbi:zinc finger protein 605-like [Protopterus annectens]|uniref:zinc finger protein 605-like n=1 Tax=Protopterus annectens TaxID=7888 RepID=UPI001CFA7FE3|nr:zinc finger protein 605-like [Protopterus annectens]